MSTLRSVERRMLIDLARTTPRILAADLGSTRIRWDRLGATAADHRVAPLVYRNLQPFIVSERLDGPVRSLAERCRALYVQNLARNTILFRELQGVLRALRQAGIPVIVLKGAAMAPTLYGDIGLRYMRDLDVLVPGDARTTAMAVLETLGYRLHLDVPVDLRAQARRDGFLLGSSRPVDAGTTAAIYSRYHFHYHLRRRGQFFPLELHWHIATPGTRVDIADFWAEARVSEIAGVETLCLRPEHLLLHLCLHLTADPYEELRLGRFIDLDVAVERQPLDWAYLRHAAERYEITDMVRGALELTSRIVGTEISAAAVTGRRKLERVLPHLMSRWWMANFGSRRPDLPPISRVLLWRVVCGRRWGDIASTFYRMILHHPEDNRLLPNRYAGSELWNFLYGFHPTHLWRAWRRYRESSAIAGAGRDTWPVQMLAFIRRSLARLVGSAANLVRRAPLFARYLRGRAPDDHPAPNLSGAEKLLLLRLARRVVAHHLGSQRNAFAAVAPPGLLQWTEPVFVTFWIDGRMRGCQGAKGGSLYKNIVNATQRTLEDTRVSPLGVDELPRLRIEVDVLGRRGRLRARRLERFGELIEPGIHGVAAEKDGKVALFRSSVAITKNWGVAELIPRLCEKGGWS